MGSRWYNVGVLSPETAMRLWRLCFNALQKGVVLKKVVPMNVIILSPHYPPNQINYARAVKRHGDVAIGIGDSASISDELRSVLDEYVYIADMTQYDTMLRTVGYLTSKYGKIDRIDSQNEFWLGIESQLREDFNITGQKPAQTDINRSKVGMKRVAQSAGLPVARGVEVESLEQLRQFIGEVGLPVVVKPVVGVGAAATYCISHEDEIESTYHKIHGRYICEEYIRGSIVTFDGFVDRHGHVEFQTSHEYNSGVMECVNAGRSIYYYNVTDIDPALIELGHRCIEAFGVRERFFHIEWFRVSEHEYCFLEINVRPPGLYTIDMMNYSADIDLYEMWAASFHDEYPYRDNRLLYSVGFAGRRSNEVFKYSNEEIIQMYGNDIIEHAPVPGAFSDAMGEYYFMIRHRDVDRVRSMLKDILELR